MNKDNLIRPGRLMGYLKSIMKNTISQINNINDITTSDVNLLVNSANSNIDMDSNGSSQARSSSYKASNIVRSQEEIAIHINEEVKRLNSEKETMMKEMKGQSIFKSNPVLDFKIDPGMIKQIEYGNTHSYEKIKEYDMMSNILNQYHSNMLNIEKAQRRFKEVIALLPNIDRFNKYKYKYVIKYN